MTEKSLRQKAIPKEGARAFLVAQQGFQQRRGKLGTLETIRRLGCVQIDPVRVVHRNHHLVLHSRVKDYRTPYLDTLLYEDRTVFEYWCNGKSVIPIEDFRYFRYRMKNCMDFHSPFYERVKAVRPKLKQITTRVLAMIRDNGPMCAKDFESIGDKTAGKILNLLWDCGEVMIHHIEGNYRFYDLTERILPGLDDEVPTRGEYDRFMIRKYMRAYSLIDVRSWRFGWLALKSRERKAIVERMLEKGEIHPVRIKDVEHIYYILDENLSALEKAGEDSREKRVHLAPPLDNLIWNRKMISEIFGFTYSWDIYKTPDRRPYGYYAMPILYGTKLVGRIDPKLDRKSKTMIINSIFLEEKLGDAFAAELAATLERLLLFHDASSIRIVESRPRSLKASLSARLPQFAA